MAGSLNKVLIIGNLGRDPELKSTPSGQSVANFSVATTERWKDNQGNQKSETTWHNIQVWGKQAEVAERYLRKGSQVHIEGRIQIREYTDKQGVKRQAFSIRCDNFIMLDKLEQGGGRREQPDQDPHNGYETGGQGGGGFDDDFPF